MPFEVFLFFESKIVKVNENIFLSLMYIYISMKVPRKTKVFYPQLYIVLKVMFLFLKINSSIDSMLSDLILSQFMPIN